MKWNCGLHKPFYFSIITKAFCLRDDLINHLPIFAANANAIKVLNKKKWKIAQLFLWRFRSKSNLHWRSHWLNLIIIDVSIRSTCDAHTNQASCINTEISLMNGDSVMWFFKVCGQAFWEIGMFTKKKIAQNSFSQRLWP